MEKTDTMLTSALQATVQPPQYVTTNTGDMKFDQLSKNLAHPAVENIEIQSEIIIRM